MMDLKRIKELCNVVGEFMQRATLQGKEVPAWTEAYNFINSLFTGEVVLSPREVYEILQTDNTNMAKIRAVYKEAPTLESLQAYISNVGDQPEADQPQPFFDEWEAE